MGYFSRTATEIMELYEDGFEPDQIAKMLHVEYSDVEYVIASYFDNDIDESMDGDCQSALASAGWGTDEDYGYAEDMI